MRPVCSPSVGLASHICSLPELLFDPLGADWVAPTDPELPAAAPPGDCADAKPRRDGENRDSGKRGFLIFRNSIDSIHSMNSSLVRSYAQFRSCGDACACRLPTPRGRKVSVPRVEREESFGSLCYLSLLCSRRIVRCRRCKQFLRSVHFRGEGYRGAYHVEHRHGSEGVSRQSGGDARFGRGA